MHSTEIRQKFLDFFQSKGHTVKNSSPLIPPPDDPTLLFTTAGMLQFKPLWAGAPLSFNRAVSVQKCLRAGGKGSDLENVGRTLRHHTFFEMLGNFSFGDYFKKEAILLAWEFVTKVLGLPKENLWVSIYLDDDEAYSIWRKGIGLSEKRIIRLGEKENFWGPAGATGACGPSSEIYFDLGVSKGCGKSSCQPGCDCERYLEFWNLVFPQFYQNEDGSRRPLERRGIDTGMGLERLAFLLQGKAKSNYETDLFKPIVNRLSKITKEHDEKQSVHVVSDHIRALTFALSENIMPSNFGRGYVLRRLLRRAVRHGRKLGIMEPFLYKLVDSVVDVMREPYPELIQTREHVKRIIMTEEERFQHTIDYGLYMLEEMLKKQKQKVIPGKDIFKLYDTFGFPVDLMQEIVEERGFGLDYPGFEKLMSKQKERARKGWEISVEKVEVKPVYREIQPQDFIGYDTTKAKAKIIALIINGKKYDTVSKNAEVEIFLDKTPFYPEAGGQIGDTGLIISPKGEVEVLDARRIMPGIISHKTKVKEGIFNLGDEVEAVVDCERRLSIAQNHTATHLLQYALREILGDHVKQCGSLVTQQKLRFDFTHFMEIDPQEIERIENLVNEKVMEDSPVNIYSVSLKEALDKDVLAFFGEKYGEKVRVVDIGGYSKELCGGTHIKATGQIGLFRILSEGSIASGVRRIEAVCGKVSAELARSDSNRLTKISKLLKIEPEKIVDKLEGLLTDYKELSKHKDTTYLKEIISKADAILAKARSVGEVKVVTANLGSVKAEHMRSLGDVLKEKMKSGIIVLGSSHGKDKVNVITVITKDLVKKGYHAGKIVKEVAVIVGGTGGGRPDMAQAGGKKPEFLDKAIKEVTRIISSHE